MKWTDKTDTATATGIDSWTYAQMEAYARDLCGERMALRKMIRAMESELEHNMHQLQKVKEAQQRWLDANVPF